METKVCRRCKQEKPLAEFTNNKAIKDGKCLYCRECDHEFHRKWYRAHSEATRSRVTRYNQEHHAEKVKYHREWIDANPGYDKIMAANQRARAAGVSGELTLQDWLDTLKRYEFRCLCCGRSVPEIELTIDHVIPLSKGGPNVITNIQPLCMKCNRKKWLNSTDYRLQVQTF